MYHSETGKISIGFAITITILACIESYLLCSLMGTIADRSGAAAEGLATARPLPTSRPTARPTPRFYHDSFTTSAWKPADEWEGVIFGMHSAQVLQLHPFEEQTEPLKLLDARERLVAFYYPDAIIVFKSQFIEGATVDDDLELFVEEIYVRRE